MVYFVGAGSGAADLITVRGARLLGEADVIIYAGSLVNPALLDLKNFLRRRKVYLYINEERYLRAERICHEMLEEKENENFAIDELAYIQQIRRARGEDSPSIHDESGNFVDDLPF